MAKATQALLKKIYRKLLSSFGPQHWWPAQTKFEVIVGAILTQNTNWANVERALDRLKQVNILSPHKLHRCPPRDLAALIKPAGYFNVKAKRLRNFLDFFIQEYQGDLNKMKREKSDSSREKLLGVNGIGPETADSILLYALDKPVFVVDAYTKRIFYRHNLLGIRDDYAQIQRLFMNSLPRNTKMFNEFHALIVNLGKSFCKTDPICRECPLRNIRYSLDQKCSRCHRAFLPHERKQCQGSKKNKKCMVCSGD